MEGIGGGVGFVPPGIRLHPVIEMMSRLIVMGSIPVFIESSFESISLINSYNNHASSQDG